VVLELLSLGILPIVFAPIGLDNNSALAQYPNMANRKIDRSQPIVDIAEDTDKQLLAQAWEIIGPGAIGEFTNIGVSS